MMTAALRRVRAMDSPIPPVALVYVVVAAVVIIALYLLERGNGRRK